MKSGDSFTIKNKYNLADGHYIGTWPSGHDIKVMRREIFKVEGDPRTHRRTVETGITISGDDWAEFRSGVMSRSWGMFGTDIIVSGDKVTVTG